MGEWRAVLNGVTVCGGDCEDAVACLLLPPDGLGVPPVRTEDQTYAQRDGTEHFADWYEPRTLILNAAIGGQCSCSGDARKNARALMDAWSRSCDDDELVIFTPCSPEWQEQVTDGSFEIGPGLPVSSVIGGQTLTRSTTASRSPTHSARLSRGGGAVNPGNAGAGLTGNCQPGDMIKASGWLLAGATPRSIRLEFRWLNGVTTIDTNYVDGVDQVVTWTELALTALAPEGATGYDVRWVAFGLTGNTEFHYLDDISILFAEQPELNGPFGAIGRARSAPLSWRRGKQAIADALLRFDAVDHRLYVLDPDGTPGSGAQTVTPPLNQFVDSLSDGLPFFVGMYRLNELGSGDFMNLTGANPNVEFDPQRATRGFPQAHYAGVADGFSGSIGASTYFPAKYTGVGADDFFEGLANSDTSFTWSTWYRTDTPGVQTTIAEFNSALYYFTTRRYHHNGTDYALSAPTIAALEDGDWHHFLFTTNNGSATRVYVDGALTDTLGFTGVVGTAITRAYIAPVKGFYSEMVLWSSVLTADQIASVAQVLDTEPVAVAGSLCVPMLITFTATGADLIGPSIVLDDGSYVGIDTVVLAGQSYQINTETGDASVFIAGEPYPSDAALFGDPYLTIDPGTESVGFRTKSGTIAAGTATVSWRPAVISA